MLKSRSGKDDKIAIALELFQIVLYTYLKVADNGNKTI
jgi:hypothetical protein